jgi:serine/threonine protein phosphatase PrpC
MTKIKIEQIGLTDIGRVRQANEDNYGYAESPVGQIFTVCDGMGGHVGGAIASKIAVSSILEYLMKVDLASPSVEINNAIVFANQQILEHVISNPSMKGMGTTCTVMVVKHDSIHIGHVGDSRIYIFTNNELFRLTKDHSYVQNLVDSGALTELEAENHPRKNELTRALGVRSQVEPTVNSISIQPKRGDKFLLCSDGLCGYVDDRAISTILSNNNKLEQTAAVLVKAANDMGGFDNITVQLANVIESPFVESAFEGYSFKRENLSSTMQIENDNVNANQPQKIRSKNLRTEHLVIISSLLLGLLLIAYYLVSQMADEKVVKVSVVTKQTNKDSLNKSKDTASFNCDSKSQDLMYLSHFVSKDGETYNQILQEHKAKYLSDEVDFSVVFDRSNKVLKTPYIIKKGESIKWKMKIKQTVLPEIRKAPKASTNVKQTVLPIIEKAPKDSSKVK